MRSPGFFWVLAALLFTAINLPRSGWSALVVGGAMLLGGETTCAVGYLLSERIVRPITALALAGAAAADRSRPGRGGAAGDGVVARHRQSRCSASS